MSGIKKRKLSGSRTRGLSVLIELLSADNGVPKYEIQELITEFDTNLQIPPIAVCFIVLV
jgi:hypothetical protein